tara:strand:+ start:14565 stop:14855 length:291 start_codon:yes stop_codon:yes gene_type:complete
MAIELLSEGVYTFRFTLDGKLYEFEAIPWDGIQTAFDEKYPEFILIMHDECDDACLYNFRGCPGMAQVHHNYEVVNLLQVCHRKSDPTIEHLMHVS